MSKPPSRYAMIALLASRRSAIVTTRKKVFLRALRSRSVRSAALKGRAFGLGHVGIHGPVRKRLRKFAAAKNDFEKAT
jgi:hypothetical protein